jgi:Flp pilus assembly protein TadG
MSQRAQALVELAVCAPILVLLALGGVAIVQLETATAGLDAATDAAATAAARAPDSSSAVQVATLRFASVAAAYPLRAATIQIMVGDFARGGEAVASSSADVELGWAIPGIPNRLHLRSRAVAELEPWRTHR